MPLLPPPVIVCGRILKLLETNNHLTGRLLARLMTGVGHKSQS